MSISLVVLCLAAFAVVTVTVSGIVRVALPVLDRLATKLSPRHRARMWLALVALPATVGLLALGASFLPAMGLGHDHCLAHGPHHPHLCPHHIASAPGIVLVLIALLSSARVLRVLVAAGQGLRLSRDTSGTLAQASDRYADTLVFPSDEPQAFVLGALRPRVHVSRGLLALGPDVVEPALAHERVHAAKRDLLWRALCPVFALGHSSSMATALRSRFATAQEMAADAEAARVIEGGRLQVAEALLVLTRLARTHAHGISFTHGDVETRIHALLDDPPAFPRWPVRFLIAAAVLLPATLGVSHDLIHHGLETFLGALS